MPRLKYYNPSTEQWEYVAVGAQGPSGIIVSDTAPESTSGLWLDSDEEAEVPVPEGGTTGQVLAKSSNDDYDTEWANNTLANLDDTSILFPPNSNDVLTYSNNKWRAQPSSIPFSVTKSIILATTTYEAGFLLNTNQDIQNLPTVIDGVTVNSSNNSLLLVGQTNPVENGLYFYDSKTPAWFRDVNRNSEYKLGATYYIRTGTVYGGSTWILTSNIPRFDNLPTGIDTTTALVFEPYTPSVPDPTPQAFLLMGA
jgi:hypothetical protein